MTTLAHTLRSLLRRPGFLVATVLTLALGIGATSLVFCVVDGVLFQPLPFPAADRLVRVFHTAPGLELVDDLGVSDATFLRLRESGVFEDLAVYRSGAVNFSGEGAPERVTAAWASHSFTATLGIVPLLGRPLRGEDTRPGAPPVMLLGEDLWRRRFGGGPEVLGETMPIDGVSREVVGVLPAGFRFPEPDTEVWLPYELDPAATNFGHLGIDAVGRLPDGVTPEDFAARVNAQLTPVAERFPVEQGSKMLADAGFTTRIVSLRDHVVGDLHASLWILLASVGFFLLLAGANVANLLLVRAAGRERELAVRTALGAGRRHLMRAFLLEGALLGLAGGLGGWALTQAGLRALKSFGPPNLPRLHELGVDARTLLFALAVSLATGLAVGLAPALRYGGRWLTAALREGGRATTSGPGARRARDLLVGLQVAIALVLLVGAGLTIRSLWVLAHKDPGFDPDGVLTLQLNLPPEEYPGEEAPAAFIQRALDVLGALPAVESAGASGALPLDGGLQGSGVSIEDHPDPPDALARIHFDAQASPGYFETLRIPILAGRSFTRADHERRTGAMVVSEAFVRRYWPEGSALGKRLQPRDGEPDPDNWYTIVGVVGDVHQIRLEEPPPEIIYRPLVSLPGDRDSFEARAVRLVLRTTGDAADLAPAVRQRIRSLDPHLPVASVQTLDQVVARAMARRTFVMSVLALAGLGALLIGAIGIYGVVSYLVTERTREIGIRMALGATPGRVVAAVVRRAVVVSAVGIACGMVAAILLGQLMGAVLFEVDPYDPWTLAAAAVLLGATAALASFLPAQRAGRLDPLESLAAE